MAPSAVTSLYHLSLDDVVATNCKKIRFRSQRGVPTALHDEGRDPKEQFPRAFDISFIPISPQKSRMYFQGRPLGSDLTDNAYDDDGYRFHDVLHLALIAHLGWSPVVRGLMRRKRKGGGNEKIDEVEDGGRAQVVEELVLKAIHSEGERLAKASERCAVDGPYRLFSTRSLISFRLLKTLQMYVEGLEVARNMFWEWENAIYEGCEIFAQLRAEHQGTVHVDLMSRRLTFSPTVSPDVRGATVGMGMTATSLEEAEKEAPLLLSPTEMTQATTSDRKAELISTKKSVLGALGVPKSEASDFGKLHVTLLDGNRISVKAVGDIQARAFSLRVVDYKAAVARVGDNVISTVTAIADVGDISK